MLAVVKLAAPTYRWKGVITWQAPQRASRPTMANQSVKWHLNSLPIFKSGTVSVSIVPTSSPGLPCHRRAAILFTSKITVFRLLLFIDSNQLMTEINSPILTSERRRQGASREQTHRTSTKPWQTMATITSRMVATAEYPGLSSSLLHA